MHKFMIKLRNILIETFKNSNIPEDISHLKIGDIEEWDSLGNFNLILAIERHFQIQFDIEDLENITSIVEIEKRVRNFDTE